MHMGEANAAPDPAEMMRRQQLAVEALREALRMLHMRGRQGTPDPAEMMRRQQAGGRSGGLPVLPRGWTVLRFPVNGAGGAGRCSRCGRCGRSSGPAEMMRRQQAGGAPGAGGAPDPQR